VQVALLATDDAVQGAFADLGVPSQTLKQVAPVRVRKADGLMAAWSRVGACPTLGLTGRAARRPGALATARVYRLRGDPYLFLPVATDPRSSLGARDPAWLAQRIRAEIAFLHRHARGTGRPTLAVLLRPEHLGPGHEALLALVADLRGRRVDGVPVRLDRLATLLPTAASERIDDLGDWVDDAAVPLAPAPGALRLRRGDDGTPLAPDAALAIEREGRSELIARVVGSDGLEQQAAALAELARRDGVDALVPLAGGRSARVGELLDEIDAVAAERGAWGVLRTVAGVRDRLDPAFVDALDELLVAQKRVVLAKGYSEDSVLTRPVPVAELRERLRTFGSGDLRDRSLTQEIVVALADLARAAPERFRGVLTLRVGALVALLAAQLAAEADLTPDEGHEALVCLSPAAVAARLDGVLAHGDDLTSRLRARERLTLVGGSIRWQPPAAQGSVADEPPADGWWRWRQREGALNRVPKGFYARVWTLLGHARGLVIGDKLDRRHRIDAATVRAATTAGEKNFALRVEHLLHRIPAPEYRHLSVEALATMADVVAHDPGVRLDGDLAVDVLVGHAVRRAWLAQVGEAGRERYDADTAAAWAAFYDRSPADVAGWFVEALRSLVEPAERPAP
jgi:phosphorylase kinase alpha/beta subunit